MGRAGGPGGESFLHRGGVAVHAQRPPAEVLHAFGVRDARLLRGGQGNSWRAGDLVLKPDAGPVWEWLAPVLLSVAPEGLQISTPVSARDGSWTHLGWSATSWVLGREPDKSKLSTWVEIIEAGRTLHRALARIPRAACLDDRVDPWALADRAAWDERAPGYLREFTGVVNRLRSALSPLGTSQLVHGDLTGNVLVGVREIPVVIDISPYWRPPSYAEGVVVADALSWHAASARLLDVARVPVSAVARALLFRIGATSERVNAGRRGIDVHDEAARFGRAAAAIGL